MQRHWKYLLGASAVVVLSMTAFASASAQVKGSKHDLSITGLPPAGVANYGQVCVYCHTPHKAYATLPLWNHTATAQAAFTMYNSSVSGTMVMTVAATPGPVSLACLSCHDGTIALDGLKNLLAGSPVSGAGKMTVANTVGAGGVLTTDHPIAVTYAPGLDAGAYVAAVTGKVGTLPLYGTLRDQVECASCHNVHSNANTYFLRAANTASALCLTCHIK